MYFYRSLCLTDEISDHPVGPSLPFYDPFLFRIVYDVFAGSFGGIISETVFVISIIISLIRNKKSTPDVPTIS